MSAMCDVRHKVIDLARAWQDPSHAAPDLTHHSRHIHRPDALIPARIATRAILLHTSRPQSTMAAASPACSPSHPSCRPHTCMHTRAGVAADLPYWVQHVPTWPNVTTEPQRQLSNANLWSAKMLAHLLVAHTGSPHLPPPPSIPLRWRDTPTDPHAIPSFPAQP